MPESDGELPFIWVLPSRTYDQQQGMHNIALADSIALLVEQCSDEASTESRELRECYRTPSIPGTYARSSSYDFNAATITPSPIFRTGPVNQCRADNAQEQ